MAPTVPIFLHKLRELRQTRDMSRDDFERFKLEKFRRLARHANAHSRHYATIVEEHGIDLDTCSPPDFPVLTKADLMRHFDDIVTVPEISKQVVTDFLSRSVDPGERLFDEYRIVHTSGSSGEVGYFVFSQQDWVRGMSLHRGSRARARRDKRKRRGFRRYRLAYYAATGGHFAGVTMVAGMRRGLFKYLIDVELFEVNDPLVQIVERLNAYQPDYLVGYTTALRALADKQLAGDLRLAVDGMATSGEVQSPADKEHLEAAFDCDVVNIYASSEHLSMGAGLPDSSRMVLYDDELIFELHDDHSIVTNLFNFTMPLIRYRMADVIRPIPDDSSASPYLVIESLVGRTEISPTFTTVDGTIDFVSPHTINEIYVPGVARFQLQLTGPSTFRFLICLDPRLEEPQRARAVAETERRLRAILDQKRMQNVVFEVAVAEDLPINEKTRKFQLIVDERGSGANETGVQRA
jgi:phenylacetate-CoA ligase